MHDIISSIPNNLLLRFRDVLLFTLSGCSMPTTSVSHKRNVDCYTNQEMLCEDIIQYYVIMCYIPP